MAAKLEVLITGQDSLSSVFKNLQSAGSSLSDSFKRIGEVAIGTFVEDIAGHALEGLKDFVVEGLKSVVDEASKGEDAFAKLAVTFRANAGAAGQSMDALVGLSQSLQDTTTFSHETVQAAESIILRFHDIGANVFPETIKVSTDLAAALGIDLSSAATMVGKALTDPGVGLLRLKAAGVDFNAESIKMIKNLGDTGHMAEAQSIILEKLQSTIGGTAEAMGGTFSGDVERLTNKFNDLKEQVGNVFLPVLEKLSAKVLAFVNSAGFQQGFTAFVDGLRAMLERGIALGTSLVEYLAENWQKIQGGLMTLKGYFDQATGFIRGTISTIISYFQQNGWKGLAELVWAWAKTAVGWAGDRMGELLTKITDWVKDPKTVQGFKDVATKMAEAIGDGLVALGDLLGKVGEFFANVLSSLSGGKGAQGSSFLDGLGKIATGIAQGLGDGISKSALKDVDWDRVGGNLMQGLGDGIRAWAQFNQSIARWILGSIWDFFTNDEDPVWLAIQKLFDLVGHVISTVNWAGLGGDIMSGIADGIRNGLGMVAGALSNAMQGALAAARAAIGAHSPSTLFAEQMGAPIAQGIAAGIVGNSGLIASAISSATGGMLGTGGYGGGSSSVVNNSPSYNLHITTSAPSESMIQDFQLLRALAQ